MDFASENIDENRFRLVVGKMIDGERPTTEEQVFLAQTLENSQFARDQYLEMMLVHSEISEFLSTAESLPNQTTDTPDSEYLIAQTEQSSLERKGDRYVKSAFGRTKRLLLGLAAAVLVPVGWIVFSFYQAELSSLPENTEPGSSSKGLAKVNSDFGQIERKESEDSEGEDQDHPNALQDRYYSAVARITHSEGAVWNSGKVSIPVGCWLPPTRLKLNQGKVKITFDKGAEVSLKGPAEIELLTNSSAILHFGQADAFVPKPATGFLLKTPQVDVTDIGTRFSVIAKENGASTVAVHEGEVRIRPKSRPREQSLFEKQAVLVDAKDVQTLSWSETKPFPKFGTETQAGDSTNFGYYYWSFDQPVVDQYGRQIWPETGRHQGNENYPGMTISTSDENKRILHNSQVPGVNGKALNLLGNSQSVQTKLPGPTADTPRTVCLWVKIPKSTKIPNAYSMVSWGDWKKKGGKWQIGWNPNYQVDCGVFGALRTEISHAFVVGQTDLRDGRWHHVACVYLGGSYSDIRAKIRLYVDGKLEPFSGFRTAPTNTVTGDSQKVVFGKYLGNMREFQSFEGAIDETYLFEGALTPSQIRDLIKNKVVPKPSEIIPTSYFDN